MKSTSIAHLIKIGNKTHIESLRDNGLVFMNTIRISHWEKVYFSLIIENNTIR